jgi:hypothetical protein
LIIEVCRKIGDFFKPFSDCGIIFARHVFLSSLSIGG